MNSISVGPKSFYRGALRHDYWFPPPNMAGNRQTLRFCMRSLLFCLVYYIAFPVACTADPLEGNIIIKIFYWRH